MTTSPSIRERILKVIKKRFDDVNVGVGGHSVKWSVVKRTPLTSTLTNSGSALSILDVEEAKTAELGYMRCLLTVATEFFYRAKIGDDLSVEANRLLSDIQLTMRSDIYAFEVGGTQLAINIEEIRNEIDIDSEADKLINGIVYWRITYRHAKDNPTLPL